MAPLVATPLVNFEECLIPVKTVLLAGVQTQAIQACQGQPVGQARAQRNSGGCFSTNCSERGTLSLITRRRQSACTCSHTSQTWCVVTWAHGQSTTVIMSTSNCDKQLIRLGEAGARHDSVYALSRLESGTWWGVVHKDVSGSFVGHLRWRRKLIILVSPVAAAQPPMASAQKQHSCLHHDEGCCHSLRG